MSNPNQVYISRDDNGEIQATNAADARNQAAEASNVAGTGVAQTRVNDTIHRVNIRGGEVSEDAVSKTKVTTASIVDDKLALQPESVIATARSSFGRPLQQHEITDTTLITAAGMQVQAKTAADMGILYRDPATGTYHDCMPASSVAGMAEAAPEAAPEHFEALDSDTLDLMAYATRHFSETTASQFLLQGLTGELNEESFTRSVEAAGGNAQESQAFMIQALESIIDDLAQPLGLADDDDFDSTLDSWENFTELLTANHGKAKFQDAVRQLVLVGDAKPLVSLVDKSHSKTGVMGDVEGVPSKVVNGQTLYGHTDADGFTAWTYEAVGRKLGWW